MPHVGGQYRGLQFPIQILHRPYPIIHLARPPLSHNNCHHSLYRAHCLSHVEMEFFFISRPAHSCHRLPRYSNAITPSRGKMDPRLHDQTHRIQIEFEISIDFRNEQTRAVFLRKKYSQYVPLPGALQGDPCRHIQYHSTPFYAPQRGHCEGRAEAPKYSEVPLVLREAYRCYVLESVNAGKKKCGIFEFQTASCPNEGPGAVIYLTKNAQLRLVPLAYDSKAS